MTLTEPAGSQRNGHARKHHPEATRQQQEAFRSLQGVANAGLALIDIQQLLPRLQLSLHRLSPLPQRRCGSGKQLPVLYPAARLHHTGSQVIGIDRATPSLREDDCALQFCVGW